MGGNLEMKILECDIAFYEQSGFVEVFYTGLDNYHGEVIGIKTKDNKYMFGLDSHNGYIFRDISKDLYKLTKKELNVAIWIKEENEKNT